MIYPQQTMDIAGNLRASSESNAREQRLLAIEVQLIVEGAFLQAYKTSAPTLELHAGCAQPHYAFNTEVVQVPPGRSIAAWLSRVDYVMQTIKAIVGPEVIVARQGMMIKLFGLPIRSDIAQICTRCPAPAAEAPPAMGLINQMMGQLARIVGDAPAAAPAAPAAPAACAAASCIGVHSPQ